MANNVTVTPGIGATIATDQVAWGGAPDAHAQVIKIVDGREDSVFPLMIDSGGRAQVTESGLRIAGTNGKILVGATPLEARVGATLLSGRKALLIYNNSGSAIEWGFNASLAYGTGIPVPSQQCAPLSVGELPVYVVGPGGSSNLDVRIAEAA